MTVRFPGGTRAATFLGLAALVALAACGSEPKVVVKTDGDTSVTTGSGMLVIDKAAEGKALDRSADLAAYTPAYPGARLTTRIARDDGEGGGALVVYETTDPLDKVAAFYDRKADEEGVKADVIVTEADSAVRIFGNKEAGRGAMVAISKADEGPGSKIVITSGLGEAEVVRMERQPETWRESVRMPVRLQ